MSVSRRTFVQALGIGSAGLLGGDVLGARGREDLAALALRGEQGTALQGAGALILSSNENLLGRPRRYSRRCGWRSRTARSPAATCSTAPLDGRGHREAVWRQTGRGVRGMRVDADPRAATQLFTSPTRALVGSIPTYEECAGYAALIGSPVTGVKLDAALKLDLDGTLATAKGAGLVFYCNPNNPTATVHWAARPTTSSTRCARAAPTRRCWSTRRIRTTCPTPTAPRRSRAPSPIPT